LARPTSQSELAFLVEAGAADFEWSAPAGACPSRWRSGTGGCCHAQQTGSDAQQLNAGKNVMNGEAFGELLRHEMNNPLTGILATRELLPRRCAAKMTAGSLAAAANAFETIAALAVRLRETSAA